MNLLVFTCEAWALEPLLSVWSRWIWFEVVTRRKLEQSARQSGWSFDLMQHVKPTIQCQQEFRLTELFVTQHKRSKLCNKTINKKSSIYFLIYCQYCSNIWIGRYDISLNALDSMFYFFCHLSNVVSPHSNVNPEFSMGNKLRGKWRVYKQTFISLESGRSYSGM